jgi:hypothetical protein
MSKANKEIIKSVVHFEDILNYCISLLNEKMPLFILKRDLFE